MSLQIDKASPTPLVELTEISDLPGLDGRALPKRTRLFAKLESVHPSGSIKDRSVRSILETAVKGRLIQGRRVLDSSSGNAGVAYAAIGAQLGLPVTLVIPGNASTERLDRIRAHGAELILTDPLEGYDFAVHTARRLARDEPERYWYADQYGSDANWKAHFDGTGVELVGQVARATGLAPDAFVSGIGTGGTITGVARRLAQANGHAVVAAVAPDPFPGIEGLKPLGGEGDLVPGLLDESLIDVRIPVSTEDAIAAARAVARLGYFVGPSSGANVLAAARLAAQRSLSVVTTVLCDVGERYLSTGMWRESEREAQLAGSAASMQGSCPPAHCPDLSVDQNHREPSPSKETVRT